MQKIHDAMKPEDALPDRRTSRASCTAATRTRARRKVAAGFDGAYSLSDETIKALETFEKFKTNNKGHKPGQYLVAEVDKMNDAEKTAFVVSKLVALAASAEAAKALRVALDKLGPSAQVSQKITALDAGTLVPAPAFWSAMAAAFNAGAAGWRRSTRWWRRFRRRAAARRRAARAAEQPRARRVVARVAPVAVRVVARGAANGGGGGAASGGGGGAAAGGAAAGGRRRPAAQVGGRRGRWRGAGGRRSCPAGGRQRAARHRRASGRRGGAAGAKSRRERPAAHKERAAGASSSERVGELATGLGGATVGDEAGDDAFGASAGEVRRDPRQQLYEALCQKLGMSLGGDVAATKRRCSPSARPSCRLLAKSQPGKPIEQLVSPGRGPQSDGGADPLDGAADDVGFPRRDRGGAARVAAARRRGRDARRDDAAPSRRPQVDPGAERARPESAGHDVRRERPEEPSSPRHPGEDWNPAFDNAWIQSGTWRSIRPRAVAAAAAAAAPAGRQRLLPGRRQRRLPHRREAHRLRPLHQQRYGSGGRDAGRGGTEEHDRAVGRESAATEHGRVGACRDAAAGYTCGACADGGVCCADGDRCTGDARAACRRVVENSEQQLAEAVAAKDAAKVQQLATTDALRATVIASAQADTAFLEALVADRAARQQLVVAVALNSSDDKLLKKIATDLASKTDAVKQALALGKTGILLTAIGLSNDPEWKTATNSADYDALVAATNTRSRSSKSSTVCGSCGETERDARRRLHAPPSRICSRRGSQRREIPP